MLAPHALIQRQALQLVLHLRAHLDQLVPVRQQLPRHQLQQLERSQRHHPISASGNLFRQPIEAQSGASDLSHLSPLLQRSALDYSGTSLGRSPTGRRVEESPETQIFGMNPKNPLESIVLIFAVSTNEPHLL